MSHNTMSTFFSGTDVNTLREEGADANHFVSLIVNNAGTYTAAITRKVKAVAKGENIVEYNTFNNTPVSGEKTSFEKEESYIEYYNLEVIKEEYILPPKSELELRLEEIKRNANSYINRKYSSQYSPLPYKSLPNVETKKEEPKQERYVQQTLFTPEQMGQSVKEEEEEDIDFDGTIGYDIDHINPEIVLNSVTQIITGDVFSIYKQHIDLEKWAVNMPILYKRRFGECENNDLYSCWVDALVDFIANDVNDENLKDKGSDYMQAIWAYDVIVKLQEYPVNEYLNVFIDSLNHWLI